MCGGALKWSQIDKIVYGASEDKFGFFSEGIKGLTKKVEVVSGVMEKECNSLLMEFFRLKRE